MTCHR